MVKDGTRRGEGEGITISATLTRRHRLCCVDKHPDQGLPLLHKGTQDRYTRSRFVANSFNDLTSRRRRRAAKKKGRQSYSYARLGSRDAISKRDFDRTRRSRSLTWKPLSTSHTFMRDGYEVVSHNERFDAMSDRMRYLTIILVRKVRGLVVLLGLVASGFLCTHHTVDLTYSTHRSVRSRRGIATSELKGC